MFLLVLLYFILIWPKLPTNQWSTWSHAGNFYAEHILRNMNCSDAGRWKASGVPVVIGGNNLPSPVGIGLTNLPNIGGSCGPPWLPRFRHHWIAYRYIIELKNKCKCIQQLCSIPGWTKIFLPSRMVNHLRFRHGTRGPSSSRKFKLSITKAKMVHSPNFRIDGNPSGNFFLSFHLQSMPVESRVFH